MRGVLTRLILLVALFMGSIHSPVVAHEDGEHRAVSLAENDQHLVVDLTDDHMAPQSQDGFGDATHHHHCPAGLTVVVAPVIALSLPSKCLDHASSAATMESRAQAPPFVPPVA